LMRAPEAIGAEQVLGLTLWCRSTMAFEPPSSAIISDRVPADLHDSVSSSPFTTR
jgi:hypothetical protein